MARFGTIFGQFFHLAERCIGTMLLIMRYLHAICRWHGGGQRDSRSSWAAAARAGDSYLNLVVAAWAGPKRLAKTG